MIPHVRSLADKNIFIFNLLNMGNACVNSQLPINTSNTDNQQQQKQMATSKSTPAFPMANSPQRSSTGSASNGRKKVILGKGYGLLDWIMLGSKHPDLAGTGGVLRKVTADELARHNSESDAWTCIRGSESNCFLNY